MLLNDGSCILGLNVPIPDRFGINNNHRTVLALIKTASLIDADLAAQSSSARELLKLGEEFTFSVRGAGGARGSIGTGVLTDKNVLFVSRQR